MRRPFGPAPWDNMPIPENTGPVFKTLSKKEQKQIRKAMKEIEEENRVKEEWRRKFLPIFKYIGIALVVAWVFRVVSDEVVALGL